MSFGPATTFLAPRSVYMRLSVCLFVCGMYVEFDLVATAHLCRVTVAVLSKTSGRAAVRSVFEEVKGRNALPALFVGIWNSDLGTLELLTFPYLRNHTVCCIGFAANLRTR